MPIPEEAGSTKVEFQACAGDHWWAGRYQTGPVLATVSSAFPETPASTSEAPSPAPPHHVPAHPQQKRRKLNFLRIYWTESCHAFQPGPSRPCTRKGQRIRPQGPHRCTPMFLRVPCCSTIMTWLSLWESWVPSLLSDLGRVPCLVWASGALPSMGGCYCPVKGQGWAHSESRPAQYHRFRGSGWGSSPVCESLQLLH